MQINASVEAFLFSRVYLLKEIGERELIRKRKILEIKWNGILREAVKDESSLEGEWVDVLWLRIYNQKLYAFC